MRRWSLRILIGLAALVVLVVIVVQLVLWSSIPKNLVVGQIEQEMGLRISTEQLTTGWMGRSTLTNVSLGLPLSKQSFLKVKTLKVKHTTLFGLVLGRAIAIDSIEIDQPDILVVQDGNGQWNLQEVAQLLARTGGQKPAQEAQQKGIPKLPNVKLVDGTIRVVDYTNRTVTLSPLNVDGHADGALVWKYDVKLADAIALSGQVALGGSWRHEAVLAAHDLDPLLKGWNLSTYGTDVTGHWNGQLENGQVTGQLVLDHLTAKAVPAAGDISVSGAVDVSTGDGSVTLRPKQIDLKTSNASLPNVHLAAGAIVSDSTGIHAQAMQVAALGGLAVLDAQFDPRATAGDLTARWNGLSLPNNISHSGSLTAALRMPFAGHPSINVDLQSQGTTSSGTWNAKIILAGQGQSWKSIDWILSAPTLDYNGSHPVHLAQLIGHINQRWPTIELTDLTLPVRPHLLSQAAIDLSTSNWFFWLDAGGVTSADKTVVPINFDVNAWGNSSVYTLHELNLQVADAYIWAGGFYDRADPNPVNLDVYLTKSPQASAASLLQGHVAGGFHVSGHLFKGDDAKFHPELSIAGDFKSSDLILLDRPVGDVDLQMTGAVDNFQTRVQTKELALFQGKWNMTALFPSSQHGLQLKIQASELPVEELARFAKVSGVSGQITSASWTIQIPSPSLNAIHMDSTYALRDLNANGYTVDEAAAVGTLDNGLLKLDPIRAVSGTGKFEGSVSIDLMNPRHLQTRAKVDHWPFGTPGSAALLVSADTKLDIDLQHLEVSGPLSASADVELHKAPVAHADLSATLRGRTLSIQKLAGNVLSGTFNGTADVDIDKPLQANGQISWHALDATAFATVIPTLDGIGGLYSGTITIGPALDPRPPEPVRVDINVSSLNGHFKSVAIGDSGLVAIHAVAYVNADRAVLDHSDIHIADGLIHIWARLGKNFTSQAAIIDLENLQLNEFAHIDPNRTDQVPGLINGEFTLVGSGTNTSKLLGKGHVSLTQTDLGNFGPVAALYNVMHIGGNGSAPTGNGSFDLSLEQNALEISNFRFFNRGLDAHGLFKLGPDIWTGRDAALGGQIVGSIRPLAKSRLSILADFDKIIGAVQQGLTPITLFGKIGDPKYVPSGVAEIGGSLRELLTGDANANSGD